MRSRKNKVSSVSLHDANNSSPLLSLLSKPYVCRGGRGSSNKVVLLVAAFVFLAIRLSLRLETDTVHLRTEERSIKGFVSQAQLPRGQHDPGHTWLHPYYSGMWWQSIDSMLRTDYKNVAYLEEVSFLPFEDNQHTPLMPIDWMDFSVEHLSHYVKHFASGDKQVQNRVAELLEKYILKTKEEVKGSTKKEAYTFNNESAVAQTVVILPLRVGSYLPTTTYNASDSHNSESYMARLLILQAGATIASLWKVGFSRVVVAGISENERIVAKEIFSLLGEHVTLQPLELVYLHMDGTEKEWDNVPKMAMMQLKEEVLKRRGNLTASLNGTTSWLGKDHRQWKHVYFSEPDLLLLTRQTAISYLSEQVENGFILSAHRLQPVPHMLQFADILEAAVKSNNTKLADYMNEALVSNHGSFGHVHSLELNSFCCDQGIFHPSNPKDPTQPINTFAHGCYVWVFCGFGEVKETILFEQHKLLAPYTFLSMNEGTGISLVHQRQRVCSPQKVPCD